jgi:hypothetical protein
MQYQDLDVLGGIRASLQASQLSTRASIKYASQKVTSSDHAGLDLDGGVEASELRRCGSETVTRFSAR